MALPAELLTKKLQRDSLTLPTPNSLAGVMGKLSNFRGGIRILVRHPAFAVTAILVLGLGIGINTLVFSIAEAVLLRPLPYPSPSQLVWISQGVSPDKTEYALAPDFLVWRSQTSSFSHVAGFAERFRNFVGRGEPERVLSAEVSSEFLSLLGTQSIAGRDFFATDDRSGSDRVAILTHGFCMRQFAAARSCLGQAIKLDDESFEVIGVLPDHFRFPEPLDVKVLTPLALSSDQASRELSMKTGVRHIKVIARLRPGVTLAQAQAEVDVVQHGIVQTSIQFQDAQEAKLRSLHEHLTAGISQTALALWGAVSLLWALGCLNVGSLLFALIISRRTEMAVRISLGASRLSLLKQVLAESAVLTLFGSIVGLCIAFWGRGFVVSIIPERVFGILDLEVNLRILLFVVITFLLTVLFVSLIAVWALPSQNTASLLKSSGANVIGSLKMRRILNVIQVGELALAVMLLVGAGLMVRSFWALRYRDLGFRPEQILTFRADLAPSRYTENSQQIAFFESLLQRVSTLPGVDGVALCSSAPPVPAGGMFRFSVEDQYSSRPRMGEMVRVQSVNSDYFRVLRVPLIAGKMFSDREMAGGPHVVIVNRALTRQYLMDEQVVGRKIQLGGPKAPWQTIVGVVENFKNVGLAAGPEPEVYRPYRQFPLFGSAYLLVRSSTANPLGLISPIRREVLTLDRELPIAEVQTLDERLTASIAQQRFVMSLLVGFATLALLLAVVGVYGITSHVSQQRTREIAIRMALGAQKRQVIWMIVREGLLLSLFGAALGIAGARAASHFLSSMFYGVAPSDPYTFVIVLISLISTTVCACYLTARRVTKVEPLEILRYE